MMLPHTLIGVGNVTDQQQKIVTNTRYMLTRTEALQIAKNYVAMFGHTMDITVFLDTCHTHLTVEERRLGHSILMLLGKTDDAGRHRVND